MRNFKELKCNICGATAEYLISLDVVGQQGSVFNGKKGNMDFYLCQEHHPLFERMRDNTTDIKHYFAETISYMQ